MPSGLGVCLLLLVAAIAIPSVQAQQPVESQRSRLRVSQVGAPPGSTAPPAGAPRAPKKRGAGTGEQNHPQAAALEPQSYRVEIGDRPGGGGDAKVAELSVALTVTKSTRFVCPEKPLNLIFGIEPRGNFIIDESTEETERNNRFEFYLSPLRAGVQTNLWIEMKSGTVPVRLETVAQANGNSFVGEVVVRVPGYRDELARLRTRVAALEGELTNTQTTAREQLTAATAEHRQAEEAAEGRAMRTAFALFTAAAEPVKKMKLPAVEGQGLRVAQAARSLRDPFDRWWVLIRMEGLPQKGKHGAGAVVERIELKDGRGVHASAALPYVVGAAHGSETLALVIDASSGANNRAPGVLTVVLAGGGNLTLPLAQ